MFGSFDGLWTDLPAYLSGHLILSLMALAAGASISIPLGIWASRSAAIGGPLLGAVGLMQTIPAIALLALMVPLLGGTIGFWPAFLALMVYSMLPILRNTATGLQTIDPAHMEAARGVGMTPGQQLRLVELPLALPVIIGGIRTATVWVIGTATLATPVGATSLGNFIFPGLQTRNWASVLLGCIAAAGLAILLDQMIRLVETGFARRQMSSVYGAVAALTAVTALGVMPGVIAFTGDRAAVGYEFQTAATPRTNTNNSANRPLPLEGIPVTVGAKVFTEQYILADLLEAWLADKGARVDSRINLGSTILFDALRAGSVDVGVDYSGTLWATILKKTEPIGRHRMIQEVSDHLYNEYGVLVLGPLGFENAYSFAMTRARAAELGVVSVADLRGRSDLIIGSDPEFLSRPEWQRAEAFYGLEGLKEQALDSTFMYDAAKNGRVDLIVAYTTDGRIPAYDLVILDDPGRILPPYDAVLLLSPAAAKRPALTDALYPLINSIDNELMRAANQMVDIERKPIGAASEHLRSNNRFTRIR